MKGDRIWVDGLNLLWAFSRVGPAAWAIDVRRMASLVEAYAAARESSAVIVLDGTRYEGQVVSSSHLEVITTCPPQTADEVIERLMSQSEPGRRMLQILVTDDAAMSRMASGLGIRRLSAAKFAEELVAGRTAGPFGDDRPQGAKPFHRPFEKL